MDLLGFPAEGMNAAASVSSTRKFDAESQEAIRRSLFLLRQPVYPDTWPRAPGFAKAEP